MVALTQCGTHAFVAAEVDAYRLGEKTLAQRLYLRLRGDELLTADRGFYSWRAWDAAAATGAALLWRAPTQLELPVMRVLPDGTYLTALAAPTIRGRRRERLLAAARAGKDLTDINAVPDAFDQRGLPVIHLARVIEYEVPDRVGNGTGELIALLTTITEPDGDHGARADELAAVYHQRWEEETANDQLKTHLRGPGRVLRSRRARPGVPGDLGLPDRAPRHQRTDRPSLRRRRPPPGRPTSPLRTGPIVSRPT
ncbi:MAG: hypothetical protein ACRDS0_29230 [Pseudonocardiaceae bacterium]